MLHPYEKSFRRRLNEYRKDLWRHPEALSKLDQSRAIEVLSYAVDLACRSQNGLNIKLGKEFVLAGPRDWILARIEEIAEPLVQLEDDWEFRRLLELYECLDSDLLHRLVKRGVQSTNPEVRAAAEEWMRP